MSEREFVQGNWAINQLIFVGIVECTADIASKFLADFMH